MESLHPERESIFEIARLWTGSRYINFQEFDDQIWSRVLHYSFGPCYTFDLSKVEEYEFVSYPGETRPGIEFVLAENNPFDLANIILHSKNDLPDAHLLNGLIITSISNEATMGHFINIGKKISRRAPTRKSPCTQLEYKTCQNIEDNEIALHKFNCCIPILYQGPHLDDIIPHKTQNCSDKATKEAFDLIQSKQSKCSRTQTCEMTRFSSTYNTAKSWVENKSMVYIAYKYPEVVYHNTYISYDLLSLIGEVGGILGLTLGASGLSLIESLFQRCLSFFEKKNKIVESNQEEKTQSPVSDRLETNRIQYPANYKNQQANLWIHPK